MKKKIISWLVATWLLASSIWLANANTFSTKEIVSEIWDAYSYIAVPDVNDYFIQKWIKDERLLKILNENHSYLNLIHVSNDYKYNWENFFTKKIETWDEIPEAIKKELKQVNLVIFSDYFEVAAQAKLSDNSTLVDPITVEDKKEKKPAYERKIKFDYQANKSYTYNLSDLITEEIKEDGYNYFNVYIELEFKNGEKLKLNNASSYLTTPSKSEIIRNHISNNEKYREDISFYQNLDRETIIAFFDRKFKDLNNEQYLAKLNEISKKLSDSSEKYENEAKAKIINIKTEEWLKTDEIQKYFIDTFTKISKFSDIEFALDWKIRSLKTIVELEKMDF